MSDRDFLDLDEELAEDGPDAPVGDWDAELLEDFPADDPAAADSPQADGAAASAPAATAAARKPAGGRTKGTVARRGRRQPRLHRGTGVLCFLLVVLAGLTLGTGLLTATGGAPEALLDFGGFRDPLAIGDFSSHPVNAFWLAAGVVLIAGALAALSVERRLRDLRGCLLEQEGVLEAIRNLDPEAPESWRREELQSDPDLAAVTSGLLGHYNLQQAKLNRYVGLEGELHRLEKAIAEDSRVDLEGRWENPSVGSLADQAMRLLAAREQAADAGAARTEALSERGPDLVAGLRDARGWNGATLEQLNHQGAAVERLARGLARVAGSLPQDDDRGLRRERLRQALAAVREEIAALPARAVARSEQHGGLGELIERASRLAFQIAMEVARLGAKGERLLPLTQDLEELTTELRGTVDQDRRQATDDDPRDRVLDNVRGRLADLDPELLQDGAGTEASGAVQGLAPAAREVAAGLAQLAKSFPAQAQRLGELLELASELTGIDVGTAQAPAGDGLLVDRFDPFASSSQGSDSLVADPFASNSGNSIFAAPGDQPSEFAHTVLPGQEESLLQRDAADPAPAEPGPLVAPESSAGGVLADSPFAIEPHSEPLVADPGLAESGPAPAAAPEPGALSLDGPDPFAATAPLSGDTSTVAAGDGRAGLADAGDPPPLVLDGDPATPATEPLSAAEPLPSAEERVYDLSEFDAVRVPAAPEPAREGRIYELSELGAERI